MGVPGCRRRLVRDHLTCDRPASCRVEFSGRTFGTRTAAQRRRKKARRTDCRAGIAAVLPRAVLAACCERRLHGPCAASAGLPSAFPHMGDRRCGHRAKRAWWHRSRAALLVLQSARESAGKRCWSSHQPGELGFSERMPRQVGDARRETRSGPASRVDACRADVRALAPGQPRRSSSCKLLASHRRTGYSCVSRKVSAPHAAGTSVALAVQMRGVAACSSIVTHARQASLSAALSVP